MSAAGGHGGAGGKRGSNDRRRGTLTGAGSHPRSAAMQAGALATAGWCCATTRVLDATLAHARTSCRRAPNRQAKPPLPLCVAAARQAGDTQACPRRRVRAGERVGGARLCAPTRVPLLVWEGGALSDAWGALGWGWCQRLLSPARGGGIGAVRRRSGLPVCLGASGPLNSARKAEVDSPARGRKSKIL